MRYALLKDNYVQQIATGPKPDDDWVEYPADAPDLGLHKVKRVGNQYVIEAIDFDAVIEYDLKRLKQYPPIGDQLDALWKALDPLITHPEARAILDVIKQIKTNIPKPLD